MTTSGLTIKHRGVAHDVPSKVTIKRSDWGKGYLYDYGRYCALGFVGRACGIPIQDMAGETEFDEILDACESDPDLVNWQWWGEEVATTNDADTYTNEERESDLVDLFGKAGITLEFVG